MKTASLFALILATACLTACDGNKNRYSSVWQEVYGSQPSYQGDIEQMMVEDQK